MGIPGFASRVRDCGTNVVIGRIPEPDQSQSTKAIIDGPSLAHSLLQNLKRCQRTNNGIAPRCDYREVGEAAIQWLDKLRSYGFEIEGIYFDGALPACKRHTRVDRLEKHVGSLYKFKDLYDGKNNRTNGGKWEWDISHRPTEIWPPLVSTMKTLAPPPFLVAAVIEALFASSEYAGLTWVVDGEADAFCAAAAYEIASDDGYVSISIFTNDSDLLIWESGWQTRIVMIDEMTENEDESGMTLQALRFFPTLMAVRRNHSLRLPDLISPAFEMLDPTFSFEQAVETADPELKSDEFMTFASMYWVKWPRAKLRAMKGATQEHKHTFPTDPRVSELVRHVLGQSRQRQCGKTGQSYNEKGDGPEKEEKKRILSEMREELDAAKAAQEPCMWVHDLPEKTIEIKTPETGEIKSYKLSMRPDPVHLDMFLPMLFEDPTRKAAWSTGTAFRNTAESIVMKGFGHSDTKVFEYKKTGTGIAARTAEPESDEFMKDQVTACSNYIQQAFEVTKHLKSATRWRFLIMELTLAELAQDGQSLPALKNIVEVVNGGPLATWNLVHLSARYQAEFYSLRILKQVLRCVCGPIKVLGEIGGFEDFAEQLIDHPEIAEFFEKDSISQEQFVGLEGAFREKFSA